MYCFKTWMFISFLACNVIFQCSGDYLEYIYFKHEQSWNTASRVCQSIGARLATVSSKKHVDILRELLFDPYSIKSLWIGLHRNSDKNLVWSDGQCSAQDTNGWTNFQNRHDGDYDDDKQCFRLTDDIEWDREQCEHYNTFLCEMYISSISNDCEFTETNTRLSLVPVSSASSSACLAECGRTEKCVMFSPYCSEHCILGLESAFNSSTQLYKMECSLMIPVSVNESNTDSIRHSDHESSTPLPCQPETQTVATGGGDIEDSVVINCSAIIRSHLTTVTMTTSITPDTVTSFMTSTVVTTVRVKETETIYKTPSAIIETIYLTPTPVTMTASITPDTVTSIMTSTVVTTVSVKETETIYKTPSAIIETIYLTPTPVTMTASITPDTVTSIMTSTVVTTVRVKETETIYKTPSAIIETIYLTPTPVTETLYITPTANNNTCILTTTLEASSTPMTTTSTRSLPTSTVTSSRNATASTSGTNNVFCTTFNDVNVSQEILKEVLEEIVVKLKVDTKKLSTTTRKKTSAPDHRRSSTTMGYTAGVIMLVPFVLMVVADIPRVFHDLVIAKLAIK